VGRVARKKEFGGTQGGFHPLRGGLKTVLVKFQRAVGLKTKLKDRGKHAKGEKERARRVIMLGLWGGLGRKLSEKYQGQRVP